VTARILVVEDEAAGREALAYALRGEGFDVEEAGEAETAVERAESGRLDLVVLDVMLPGLSGIEGCRRIRAGSDVPILMLSARSSEADRVLGLEAGADDYVVKPYSLAEVLSRVRAILRRRELDLRPPQPLRRVGDIEIDEGRHRVTVAGRAVGLTPSEFQLLSLLAQEPERAFTRREIVRHLSQSDYVGDERVCDAHVANLRRKIERDPSDPARIVTVRGVGYALRRA
jgi:two-component system response regulator RegX3